MRDRLRACENVRDLVRPPAWLAVLGAVGRNAGIFLCKPGADRKAGCDCRPCGSLRRRWSSTAMDLVDHRAGARNALLPTVPVRPWLPPFCYRDLSGG